MPGIYWTSVAYGAGNPFWLPTGCTGVKFYSDAYATTEIFPIAAVDGAGVNLDITALKNGGLNLSNKQISVQFASAVTVKSVKLLGNPTLTNPLAPMGWGWSNTGFYLYDLGSVGSGLYGPTKVYKTPGGAITYYDMSGEGATSLTVNFTVPAAPKVSDVPFNICTSESVTGGVPGVPITYQWLGWNGSAWVNIVGGNTLDMPSSASGGNGYGTALFYGAYSQPQGTAGNQFRLTASQDFSSGAITGEKIWSVANYAIGAELYPKTTNIGVPVTFPANATGGNGTYTYSWTATGATPSTGTGSTFSPQWATAGVKNVSVTVTSNGVSATFNTTATVNTPPISATITATPTTGDVSQNFGFSVSGVSGGVTPGSYTYAWSGPDGLTGTGTSVSKVFSSSGTKTVTCTITSGGSSNVFTVNVTVTVPAIIGTITASPTTGNIGDSITYSVSGISGGTGVYTYSWSGSDSLSGTGSSVSKSYASIGTKTATCVISSGGLTLTLNTSASIDVPAITGSITASPVSVVLGSPISFVMNASGGTGTYTYNWTGDDGFSGTTQTVNKTFSSIGTKNVTCAVTSGGVTTNFTSQVTVTAIPTLVVFVTPGVSQQIPNVAVPFTSTVSGGIGAYAYSWSTTDGFTSTVANPSFTWTTLGTKTITLTVTSGTQNVSASVTVIIMATLTPNLGRLCFVG